MRALSPDVIWRVLHCAVADGNHVAVFPDTWELYDMDTDRTEWHNLAEANPAQVARMADAYRAWAKRVGAEPWPMPQTPGGDRSGLPLPRYLEDDRQ